MNELEQLQLAAWRLGGATLCDTIAAEADDLDNELACTELWRRRIGEATELGDVRERLAELADARREAERHRRLAMEATTPLIRRARALGMGPTELQRLTGLSRRTVYDILEGEPGRGA